MCQWVRWAVVHIMACRLFSAKPLSKPILCYYQLNPQGQTAVKFESKLKKTTFHSLKRHPGNGAHCVQGEVSKFSLRAHLSACTVMTKLVILICTTGLVLGLRPANERCCYKVTPSIIGWVQTQSQDQSMDNITSLQMCSELLLCKIIPII